MSASDPTPAGGRPGDPGLPRRTLLARAGDAARLVAAAGAVQAVARAVQVAAAEAVAPAGQSPLRPMGARPEAEFRARCIGCFLCGEACPPGCIVFPSRVLGADNGLRRPRTGPEREVPEAPVWDAPGTPWILPWIAGCILCGECAAACPTGALEVQPDPWERPGAMRAMGRAVIDEKVCLPYNRVSWCGACYTACPVKAEAIRLGDGNRPTVLAGCVGCGLCVEVCPLRYKAIAVLPAFGPTRGTVRAE